MYETKIKLQTGIDKIIAGHVGGIHHTLQAVKKMIS